MLLFFYKFFIYASSFYGIYSINIFINDFIDVVTPQFKNKNLVLGIIEIIFLFLLFGILISAFHAVYPN